MNTIDNLWDIISLPPRKVLDLVISNPKLRKIASDYAKKMARI